MHCCSAQSVLIRAGAKVRTHSWYDLPKNLGGIQKMEKRRLDCVGLPPGWKREEVVRKSGLSAGKTDVYYIRYDKSIGIVLIKAKESLNRVVRGIGAFFGCFMCLLTLALATMADGAHMAAPFVIVRT